MENEMEMKIVTVSSEFDFKTITLADPQPLAGHAGFYFTQLSASAAGASAAGASAAGASAAGASANEVAAGAGKTLCLQLPECVTKQGVVPIKNAKYLDLMFERDKHDELMHWIETLEYSCQDIIDSKKELWFQSDLTRDDIETMMTQSVRLYQSGKYMLMRVFVDVTKEGQKCIAYDENEIGFDLDVLEANKTIIPLIVIEGVKFSSRSFEISLKLAQVMVTGKSDKKSSCLIKRPVQPQTTLDNVQKQMPLVVATVATVATVAKPVAVALAAKPALAVVAKPAAVVAKPAAVLAKPAAAVAKPAAVVAKPAAAVAKPAAAVAKPAAAVAKPAAAVAKPAAAIAPRQLIKPLLNVAPVATVAPVAPAVAELPLEKTRTNERRISKPVTFEEDTGDIDDSNLINLEESDGIEENDGLQEITIDYNDVSDSINLKKPNEVYYEIYKTAREKAKQCRIKAIEAYLEAKQIKTKYMLNDLKDSDESDESDEEVYNVESE